jgi:hypothetical protein
MFSGSAKMRFAGVVEMINSLIVLVYAIYLYYDYKTSPIRALIDTINSSYKTIVILILFFEAYKFGAAIFAYKKGDATEQSKSVMVNGIILMCMSAVWLYYAITTYSNTSRLHTIYTEYAGVGTREVVFIVSAVLDVICSLLFILAGTNQDKVTVRTVVVNSWGDPNRLPAVNNQPAYPQQDYYQDSYGGEQYYDNTQQYYDDGQYYDGSQQYYDDGQGYDYAQDQYTQEDQSQQ